MTFEEQLKQVEIELLKAQRKYADLKDVQYLDYIRETGSVAADYSSRISYKSMPDVMRLLEDELLNHDGQKYYITEKGYKPLASFGL